MLSSSFSSSSSSSSSTSNVANNNINIIQVKRKSTMDAPKEEAVKKVKVDENDDTTNTIN